MKTLDQPMRSRLPWLLAVVGFGVLAVPAISRFRSPPPGLQAPSQAQSLPAEPKRPAGSHASLSADTTRRLIHAGWPEVAAREVVDLNLDWFAIQAEENAGGFERQVKHLEALGSHPRVFAIVEKHPELAGLLAGVKSPEAVAESLAVSADDYHPLVGLYLQHCDDHDRTALAKALASQRSTIRMLQGRGILGAEILFMYPRPASASNHDADWSLEYDRWLNDELTARRHVPDEELASFVNLALAQGPEIRRRLTENDEFRRDFRTQIWPRLNRAASGTQQAFEDLLADPRAWDLLRLDAAEELLKGTGLVAIDLLYGFPDDGRPAYPADLHRDVIQILLRREPLSVQALLEFRRDPSFMRFLKKSISDDTRAAALAKLFQARPNHHELISQYTRLSGAALADEVGPPPHGVVTWVPFYYTVYEVPKKWLQGRDATAMDLFQAALDPVMLIVDVATAGTAEVPRQAVVMGGRATADDVARKIGEKVMTVSLEKKATELAARKLGTEAAEALAKRGGGMMADWTATAILAETQATIKGAIRQAMTIDITNLVQFLHRYGGMNRRSMKDWLGLEARLIMRGDSKVFLAIHNVPRHLLGAKAAEFLARAANDLAIGAVVESEPGQDALRQGARATLEAKDRAAKTFRSWQQHVSAIWLMQGSQPPMAVAP